MSHQEESYGGIPPYQKHSKTSKAASLSSIPSVGTKRARVLELICQARQNGQTDDELMSLTGWGGNTVRPRRRELVLGNFVRNSGRTRPTRMGQQASVWIAVKDYCSESSQ